MKDHGPSTDRSPSKEGAPWVDQRAFETFHADTAQRLQAYLRRVSGDPALAEDVLQEAYLRYLARPSTSPEPRQQSAYLFRIASNLLHDRWRREARHLNWLQRVGDLPRSSNPPSTDLRLDLQVVFERLPPRSRALLWLLHVEGHSHREAAKILGLGATSVRVLAFRARRKLAGWLEKAGFDPNLDHLAGEENPR